MQIRCPQCHHRFAAPTTQQSLAAKASAAKLTPEQRRVKARKAVEARWAKARAR